MTVSLASTTARADAFTYMGINTGVTGTVNITQLSDGLLTVTITNTSVGSTSGKITSIGFDLPGTGATGFTLVSATNANYKLVEQVSGDASGISRTFELSLLSGPNFNGGSNPNRGIVEGASATFTISGDFRGFSQQQIAQGMFLRFQNVDGEGSDVARVCGETTPTPEPATMVLLGTGLAGIAGAVRRKRKAAAAAKAEAQTEADVV